MDRRRFLTNVGATACSIAASPLVTPMAFASGPWDNRLVIILLRGAMDGLDAVAPMNEPGLAALRPNLPTDDHIPVGRGWGLHPALAPLLPLYQSGEFGAVHAVSTPYRDRRSHFDGQDILEIGFTNINGSRTRDGWLNRFLATLPGGSSELAYAVGDDHMLILDGEADVARWSPSAQLRLSGQAERLMDLVSHSDPLFRDASTDAMAIARAVQEDASLLSGKSGAERLATFTAQRLRGDARIASFSLGGWDTHGRQAPGISRALGRVSDVILTLKQGLGPEWQRTAVLCVTEFGRTVAENGTLGTDHGTGGAMLFAGGALQGGQVAGRWPGIENLYAGRDLMPTRDVRAHLAWALRGLYGAERSVLEEVVFPGLNLGRGTAILG